MPRSSAVRRSHAMSKHTTLYRGEGDTETEIEVEVCGLIEPYFSGSWDEPPDGGGVDDVRAIFYDGKKQREIQISSDEVREFSDALVEEATSHEPEPDDDWDDNDDPYANWDDDYDDNANEV